MTFDLQGNPLTVHDLDPSKLPVNKKINPSYKFIDGEIEVEEELEAVKNLKMAAKAKRTMFTAAAQKTIKATEKQANIETTQLERK